jgi:hypothetical protein
VSLGYEKAERCRNTFRLSLDLCWSRPTMPWVSACLIMVGSNGLAAEAAKPNIFTEAVKTVNATHLLNGLVDALSCRRQGRLALLALSLTG